jgi:hypothetical protein
MLKHRIAGEVALKHRPFGAVRLMRDEHIGFLGQSKGQQKGVLVAINEAIEVLG